MTEVDINYLCNFQGIYNTKEGKIYFIGMINSDKDGRIVPVYNDMRLSTKKPLLLRDSDLLKDEWSYGVPYEE